MGEVMARQGGMVDFAVHMDFAHEVVLLEERMAGGHIEVVLMFGRLERFRFEQQHSGEADLAFVFDNHVEEPSHLIELVCHVGIQQGFVSLPATPQHIVVSPPKRWVASRHWLTWAAA